MQRRACRNQCWSEKALILAISIVRLFVRLSADAPTTPSPECVCSVVRVSLMLISFPVCLADSGLSGLSKSARKNIKKRAARKRNATAAKPKVIAGGRLRRSSFFVENAQSSHTQGGVVVGLIALPFKLYRVQTTPEKVGSDISPQHTHKHTLRGDHVW